MKLKVLQTFEQGLSRAEGGAIKLLVGEYEAKQTEHGLVVTVGGKSRTLPPDIVERLTSLGLIATE
jgi:hypothetical protein